MDLKKLADQAKAIVNQRGGPESVKEDAEELRDIAKGQGSMSDKLKAAAEAIKEPGAPHDPAAEPTGQPVEPERRPADGGAGDPV